MRFNTDRTNRLAFDRVAEQYRDRPDVPSAVIDDCAQRAGLSDDALVLEVGAGAGQLTAPLLQRLASVRVHAVEPGPGLSRVLTGRLEGEPRLTIQTALFEDLSPREPFDSLWSANAFHWLDPAVAYRRASELLAPGGSLVLVWTYLIVRDESLRRSLRELPGSDLVAFLPQHDAELLSHIALSTAEGRAQLAESGHFELVGWSEHVEPLDLPAHRYAPLVLSYATAGDVEDPERLVELIHSSLTGLGIESVRFDHHAYAVVAARSTA